MEKNLKKIAQDIFQKKKERRRDLGALPLEKKIKILIELQKIASEIRKMSGRTGSQPWQMT